MGTSKEQKIAKLKEQAEWAAKAGARARFETFRLATAKALEEQACRLYAEIRQLQDGEG